MSGNFNEVEILALIAEVGHVVKICLPREVEAANAALGLPARTSLICRTLKGYVIPERRSEIAISQDAPVASGALKAILAASSVTRSELANPKARIEYNDRKYQFEFLRDHSDRGKSQLFEVRLVKEVKA